MNLNCLHMRYQYVRYAFVAFNIIFWLLGCASLAIGIWLYVAKNDYQILTPANYGATSATGLCIAAGATIVVVGFIGCSGALVENRCLIATYVLFIILIFAVELMAGLLGVLYTNAATEIIRHEMRAHMNSEYISDAHTDSLGHRLTWDRMQAEFRCCGVDSYTDWFNNIRWTEKNWVPDSCCDPSKFADGNMEHCGTEVDTTRLNFIYTEGCYKAFSKWLLEHVHIVGYMGLGFAAFAIVGMVLSLLLCCAMQKSIRMYETYEMHAQSIKNEIRNGGAHSAEEEEL